MTDGRSPIGDDRRVGRRTLVIVAIVAFGAYWAWDRVEAYRLSNAVDAIAARGEPITYGGDAAVPRTAEQREAAALYVQAAEIAYERDVSENHRAARLDVDAPGGAELSLDEIRTNYRGTDAALPLLDRATLLDFHGFEPEQRGRDAGMSSLDGELTALGSFACLRADLASIGSDQDTAVAALVPCIRLQRTLYIPRYRSIHAVRILGSLRIFFRHVTSSDSALALLEHAIDSWPEEDTMPRSVRLDRIRFIELPSQQPFPGSAFSIGRAVFHPLWLASARRALPAFDESMAIARQPWRDRWKTNDERQRALRQRFEQRSRAGLFAQLTDAFGGGFAWDPLAIRWAATELAARRIAALVLSLERYRRAYNGALPAVVNAPEDPYSGKPLIVKQDADGYVVYGLDSDGKDDGGVIYGFGAAQSMRIGPQSPRDFGIRVPLKAG